MRAILDSGSVAPLCKWIRNFSLRQNFPAAIVGNPQTGKSTLAISLAKKIDPTFTIDRIAWTATHFMKLVNDPKLGRGNVIILEEAGVNVSRAEWYSFVNKAILFIAQTYGWKGLIVLFTLPSLSLLDSRVVKLLRGYFETVKLMPEVKLVKFKFQTIDTRKKIGIKGREIYYYRPVTHVNGMRVLVDFFYSNFPEENMLQEYFKLANDYKEALASSLQKESERVDVVAEPFNFQKAMDDVMISRGVDSFLNVKKKWDYDKLCAVYNISSSRARVFAKMIEEELIKQGKEMPKPVIAVRTKSFRDTNVPSIVYVDPNIKKKREDIGGEGW